MLRETGKNLRLLVVVLAILVLTAGSVYAAIDYSTVYNVRDHIFKTDQRLSEEELDQLEARIVAINNKYGMEHVLVVNYDDDWGRNVPDKEALADDIYIQLEYGGINQSGSILLIDFYPPPGDRDIIIRTRYDLKKPFQPHVDATIEGLAAYLKRGELYEALNYYLDEMEKVHAGMGEVVDGKYVKPCFLNRLFREMSDVTTAGIAAVIALVICIIPLFTYRGRNTVSSRTYEVDGQFRLTTNTDVFSHSHTTSVYDPPKSSDSGGSSGSSGGGSGKF